VELPLPGQGFDKDRHAPGAVSDRFELAAGDLFYCPRGIMHDARTADGFSLHVTFGLLGTTWADLLLDAVAGACAATPALRRHLPTGYSRPDFDRETLRASFSELLAGVPGMIDLDAALDRMVGDFVLSRQPDSAGQLAARLAAEALTPDCVVRPRDDLVWRIETDGDAARLLAPGRDILFPGFAAPALEALLRGPATVATLPGTLDEAGRLTLARRLLREGLLTR
jgi:hypothetical protein